MTKPITHASLFSGIGGPEVAAAMLGWHNAFHCEINPFGRRVLEYWFPQSKSYEDITKTDFTPWRGKINVLTGGFPCQPFSYAGKRGGREDERYLWPQMLRAIDEIRPTWVIGENVAGITTMVEGGVLTDLGRRATLFDAEDDVHGYELRESFTIERICQDLERIGYAVQPMLIPAAAVGAPHRRDRVFIVAYASDAYGSNDLRDAGENKGESREERLQERDAVRVAGEPGDVRQEAQCIAKNSVRRGQLRGQDEEQGRERHIGGTSAGNSERICGEVSGPDAADTAGRRSGTLSNEIHPRLADGAEPLCDGRERNAANTNSKGLQESQQPGWGEDYAQAGAGLDDRAQRPRSDESPSHAIREGLQGQDKSGNSEGGQRLCVRGNFAGRDRSLHQGAGVGIDKGVAGCGRWADFPTVSPIHRGNDGLPFDVDNLTISLTKWRTESIKAYGNAIVPQVMYEIFLAIDKLENEPLS